MKQHNTPDPEELLFTLDQLQQTTEVMSRVVTRLKHQLQQMQAAQTNSGAAPTHDNQTPQESSPATAKQMDRRLH